MNSHQRRILRRSLGDMPRLPNNALFISSEAKRAQGYYVQQVESLPRNAKGEFGIAAHTTVVTNARPHQTGESLDATIEAMRNVVEGGELYCETRINGYTVYCYPNSKGAIYWTLNGQKIAFKAMLAKLVIVK